jgi:hypothetical protein
MRLLNGAIVCGVLAAGAALSAFAAGPGPASGPAAGGTDRAAEARQRFLRVERFARLPAGDQATAFEDFYRSVDTGRELNPLGLSSFPENLLDRQNHRSASGEYLKVWAGQLQAAAETKSADVVADNLASPLWWNVATYVRVRDVLLSHGAALEAAVGRELDSGGAATAHALDVVADLQLRAFTGRLLDLYLAGGPAARAAHTALVHLRDPAMVPRLLAEVEKDPASLARHAGLFQGPLQGAAMPPPLAKSLASPDVDVRYFALYAVMECKDPALAPAVARIAKDAPARSQELAAEVAATLSDDDYQGVRSEVRSLLDSPAPDVQAAAIKACARHKDRAVVPVLRRCLMQADIAPGMDVIVMQALNAVADSTFGYDLHAWGPTLNAAAIARFDAWAGRGEQLP